MCDFQPDVHMSVCTFFYYVFVECTCLCSLFFLANGLDRKLRYHLLQTLLLLSTAGLFFCGQRTIYGLRHGFVDVILLSTSIRAGLFVILVASFLDL